MLALLDNGGGESEQCLRITVDLKIGKVLPFSVTSYNSCEAKRFNSIINSAGQVSISSTDPEISQFLKWVLSVLYTSHNAVSLGTNEFLLRKLKS